LFSYVWGLPWLLPALPSATPKRFSGRRFLSVWSAWGLVKGAAFLRSGFTRRRIQFLSLLIYNADLRGFVRGNVSRSPLKRLCVPGLNCYSCPGAAASCPLGALQNSLAQGRFPFFVIGLLMLFGLTLGRGVCGFLCPFGLIQELLHRIPSPKLPKTSFTRRLSLLKYGFLALPVLALPLGAFFVYSYGDPFFCKFLCPAGTLEAGVPLVLLNTALRSLAGRLFFLKLTLLILLVAAAVFVFRPFCRFICPLGAVYSLFNRHALFGMRLDEESCIHCGKCAAVCKMDTRRSLDRECIRCGECIGRCPVQALHPNLGKGGVEQGIMAPKENS
jgi:ferredoxin